MSKFIYAAVLTALCTTAAMATTPVAGSNNTPPLPPRNEMAAGPQDGKGHVPPSQETVFKEIDKNGDGVISKDEFMAFHPPHPAHDMGGPSGQNGNPPPKPAQ